MADSVRVRTRAMEEAIARAVEACQKGCLEALEATFDEGVLPNDCDVDGCSLLHWAAINNRVPIVRRLLELGANPNVVGGLLVSSPLHWAARVGSVSSSALLVKAGAVANIRDTQGYAPIHLAVQCSQPTLVAYLLEKFSYCKDITDNSGMTPAMWAAYRTFAMFPIRTIVRSGANLDAHEHLSGSTALHIATQERNYTAIRELLLGDAKVSLRNKQHETPLDIARCMRNQKLIDMLEEAAVRQGDLPRSWFFRLPWKKIRHYGGFFLPGFLLGLTAVIFYFIHYGIAAFILLVSLCVVQCFGKVDFCWSTTSLIPIGVCIAEPLCMVITWFYYVHFSVSWWLQIIFLIVMLLLFGSLAKVFFSNPGVIERNLGSHSDFVEDIEQCKQVNYCFTCWVNKPKGAKHCGVCDRCVENFDHHCPWLHQCITVRNLRIFMVFVACVAVTAAIYSSACIFYLIDQFERLNADHVLRKHSFLILTLVIAIFHVVMLSTLFVSQCIQISENITTLDRIRGRRTRSRAYPSHSYSSHSQTSSTDESSSSMSINEGAMLCPCVVCKSIKGAYPVKSCIYSVSAEMVNLPTKTDEKVRVA